MDKESELTAKSWYRALKVFYVIANIFGLGIVVLLTYALAYQDPFLFLLYGTIIVLLLFRIVRSTFLYIYDSTPFWGSFLPRVWLIIIGIIVLLTILSAVGNIESSNSTSPMASDNQVPVNNTNSQPTTPIQNQPAAISSQDEQNCQSTYTTLAQKYAGTSTLGNTDKYLDAHFNASLGACLIEELYTRNDGMQMYDIFDASKADQNPLPKLLELDIEPPSMMQLNIPELQAESLFQNGQQVSTSNPTKEYDRLRAALFNESAPSQ